MKNSILRSVASHLYSYENDEVISTVPPQMDSKVTVYSSNFRVGSVIYNDHDQCGGGGFAIPSQSAINYPSGPSSTMTIKTVDYPYLGPGYLNTTSSYDATVPQQTLSLGKEHSFPQNEAGFETIEKARKRQVSDLIPKKAFDTSVGNKLAFDEWTMNKKQQVVSLQEQWNFKEEIKEIQRQRVPVRRSQKLSDRITALQKLVSPYGKTDTASVLQEASISIKVLQDQIQNLFHMLSASYVKTKPLQSQKTGEKQLDLRSKGLCLVPLSFTQKLNKEDLVNQHTILLNSVNWETYSA